MAFDPESPSLIDLLLKREIPETKPNGSVRVRSVRGKTSVSRAYSTYPLQFMVPKKAIPSSVDAVLVYALTFGGGIVSGDCIFFELDVGADCTISILTQGFTNVYKAVEGKTSRQILKCSVESGGLLALLPDSVMCFATAKYSQVQSFSLAPDANLVFVDWLTSGRVARGECWTFDSFRSTNHVYIGKDTPVLLDSVCLDQGLGGPSISQRMGDYHVIALIFIYGPRLAQLRRTVQKQVQSLATGAFNTTQVATLGKQKTGTQWPQHQNSVPELFASCSTVGPQGEGLVVRSAATNTRLMYRFLREQLATLQPILGILPYADNQ
ncbi:hypothetical protein R1sor_021148 [Riccia sorocarpa]|uniref:Urease accessory protein D n=1 Tax=Riccia sorocarpa TaxID=122646 RepID=A0ABD3GI08_9MARC